MATPEQRAPSADSVNYLNIALMLAAAAVALFLPFQLFLFAYAVLGPAHYLTEISWLEKRRFFTQRKYDVLILAALAAGVIASVAWTSSGFGQHDPSKTALFTFLALGGALVLAVTADVKVRLIGLAAVAGIAFTLLDQLGFLAVLLGLFLPTLVHVYLFTGFFILFGALKQRSRSGYLSFAVFLLCPIACYFLDPARISPGAYATISYWNNFSILNMTILGVDPPQTTAEARDALQRVFSSAAGLAVMRCIAFAYTYHYLNWFSKTSIIRWHEVGTRRLAAVVALWLGSIGLYLYDYSLGFKFLFCLSVTHVYLEFPLNHISIIGTARELRSIVHPAPKPELASAARSRR